ncbi:DUF2066 domain-containing protein [Neptunicella sp. SCSIO 80796]|uniref:DUF2066 domain-containing protein n=1 Tax=Neptunicella plasticusilytica TaxID=3117012 RepID=UPI003A4D5679
MYVKWVVFALSLFVSSAAMAGDVTALYDAKVEMGNTTDQDDAAKQGLQQVLIKVSGNRDVLSQPLIRQNLANATDFLLSYQFNIEQQKRIYNASYDQQKVDKLLRNANLPIWGKTRPATLLWLVEQPDETSFNRALISEQSQSHIKDKVLQVAAERGLDMSFPLLDLDDLMNVSVYDVWGRFAAPVIQASQRYNTDSLIIGRIYQYKQQAEGLDDSLAQIKWRLDWRFILGDSQFQGNVEDIEQDAVIQQVIDTVADQLASRYAIDAQSSAVSQWIELTVNNISGLEVYENVRRFLNQLTAVADVTLSHINGRKGTYKLRMIGTEQDLINTLKLDSRMQRVVDQFGQPVAELEFVWAP